MSERRTPRVEPSHNVKDSPRVRILVVAEPVEADEWDGIIKAKYAEGWGVGASDLPRARAAYGDGNVIRLPILDMRGL